MKKDWKQTFAKPVAGLRIYSHLAAINCRDYLAHQKKTLGKKWQVATRPKQQLHIALPHGSFVTLSLDYADSLHYYNDLIEYHKDESRFSGLVLHMREIGRCKQYVELHEAGLVTGLAATVTRDFIRDSRLTEDFLAGIKKMKLTKLGELYMQAYRDYDHLVLGDGES